MHLWPSKPYVKEFDTHDIQPALSPKKTSNLFCHYNQTSNLLLLLTSILRTQRASDCEKQAKENTGYVTTVNSSVFGILHYFNHFIANPLFIAS